MSANCSGSLSGASRRGKCPASTSFDLRRFTILTALRYFTAFAMAVIFISLLGGCSKRGEKTDPRIYADRYVSELYGKLHLAEEKLGQKVNQPELNVLAVQFDEGTTRSICGWKGKRISVDGITGIEGGFYDQAGNMTLYLHDERLWSGDWRCDPAVHEMAHFILYTHGIPGQLHHAFMSKAGFTVGDG